MAKIVYIADYRAAYTQTAYIANGNIGKGYGAVGLWVKPGESKHAIAIVGERTQPDLILNFILQNSAAGEIDILRFLGHGQPGYVEMGRTGFTIPTIKWFEKFANRFSASGKIELHSCLVAGDKGEAAFVGDGLCQTMANNANATVFAAEKKQLPDLEWAFEGPVRQYKPWSNPANMPPIGPDGRYAGVPVVPTHPAIESCSPR